MEAQMSMELDLGKLSVSKNEREIPDINNADDYYPVDWIFYKLAHIIWGDENQEDEIGRIYEDKKTNTSIVSIWDGAEQVTLDKIGELMDLAEEKTGKPCEWQVWESAKFDGMYKIKRVVKDETL